MTPIQVLETFGWVVNKEANHIMWDNMALADSISIYATKGNLKFDFKESNNSGKFVICPDFSSVNLTHAEKGALIDFCEYLNSKPKRFTIAESMLIDCGIHRMSNTSEYLYKDNTFIFEFSEDGSGITLQLKNEKEFIYLDYKELVAFVKRLDELRRRY